MAFTISLFKTDSENNRVVKTLTDEKQLSGELRNQTSALNPSIRIESADNISTYNYAYISEFGRYYYITDIVSVRTNCWVVSLRCDVLMSYKDEIQGLNVILDNTQETGLSNYLSSPNWVNLVKTKTDIKVFPSGLSEQGEFILITAGGDS
jgi:hypothetical protein|nr:MAG TPA: hypothetical protein [Caudoviricetes sp.]